MDFFHSFPYWHGAFGAFVKEELFICPPLHIFWYMLSMQAGAEGPGFRLGIWFPCFPCLSQESLFRARFDQVSFAWQLPTVFSGESLEVFFRRSCLDRKSTRLNSSHVKISYAVFCLKKKI